MDHIRQFSGIVGSLYDCVPDPTRWRQTLQALCDRFDCLMATLSVQDSIRSESRFSAWCGDANLVMPLVTKYAVHMPFYHLLPELEIDIPATMQTLYDLYGPGAEQTYFDTPLGKEWVVPNDIADTFATVVLKQGGRLGILNLVTHQRRPAITPKELNTFGLLTPHIRRAITIGDLFETEQRDARVFHDVIDSLSFAVIIVGIDMKLHYANPVAEVMLRDGVAVKNSVNIVSFENPLAQAAIAKAVITGERDEVALGTSGIGVPLALVPLPSIAHVLPLGRRTESANLNRRSAAAIFVAAAGTIAVPSIEAIAALFGLTAAEKKVVSQVANGLTRAAIATATGVSDSTVKSHLTTIFDKTNTKGQRELELLIRELTAPVNPVQQ
jgi:DNA-binding CsgD family transcriptional regulator